MTDNNEEDYNNGEQDRTDELHGVNYVFEHHSLKLVSMSQVAERIQLKDLDAAKRWCEANQIAVYKFSKKYVVYQFDLEYAIGKPFVSALIEKHPTEWKTILQDLIKWNALYNYFLLNFNKQTESVSQEKFGVLDQGQEQLLNRLLK